MRERDDKVTKVGAVLVKYLSGCRKVTAAGKRQGRPPGRRGVWMEKARYGYQVTQTSRVAGSKASRQATQGAVTGEWMSVMEPAGCTRGWCAQKERAASG